MGNIISTIKLGLTLIGGYLGYFFGGFDIMMVTLLLFMLVDYITGVISAVYQKELSSTIGLKGICKKVYILLLIGSINLLGMTIGINELRYIIIAFYLANEGISIIENGAKIGVPIPEKITNVLEQLKSKGSDNNE